MKKLSKKSTIIVGAAAAAVLVLGGTGVAYAATDGFEGSDTLTGADLDRASEAAVAAIGGGTVYAAERDDNPLAPYELSLTGSDGAEYEVSLSEDFEVVRTDRDDDADDRASNTGATTDTTGTGDAPVGASVDPDDLTGDELARASEAAIAAAGGGTVTDAERSDDADHAFDVEVRAADGTETDVDLDASYGVVRVDRDDR